MKKLQLTASLLRLILSVSLVVISIIASVLFYFVNTRLGDVAVDVSHAVADADASQNSLQSLQNIQKELEQKREVVERARSIVAESQSYQYQDQIITDLSDYASRAGIEITNIDFSGAAQSGTTPPATSTPPAGAAPAPTGVKSTSVSITLKNPVPYDNMLKFVKSIEQNLTKMQISKVNLSKDTSGGVTSEVLTIEVYIR